MPTKWFYKFMGDELGPCSSTELKEQAALGNISEDSLVRKGTDGKWVSAWRVEGLFKPRLQSYIGPNTGKERHAKTPPPISRETLMATQLGDSSGETEKNSLELPNYTKYAEYTNKRDWKSICQINGVQQETFLAKKEFNDLPNHLERGEVVFALASGIMGQSLTSNFFDVGTNTWLVVLTSERFLFLDHAMLANSVDTQSVRHERVQAVSASQGWLRGSITIDLGARTIVVDFCEKTTVAVMAKLANKWLAILQKKKEAPVAVVAAAPASSPLDEIKKLAELYSTGALTDEEFASAKAKLLGSM